MRRLGSGQVSVSSCLDTAGMLQSRACHDYYKANTRVRSTKVQLRLPPVVPLEKTRNPI